jgi:hypothetical protein
MQKLPLLLLNWGIGGPVVDEEEVGTRHIENDKGNKRKETQKKQQ